MKIVQIITQELKNNMDKAQLELEAILQDRGTDISDKVKKVQGAVRKWGLATDDFKYWDSFVQERIITQSQEPVINNEEENNE